MLLRTILSLLSRCSNLAIRCVRDMKWDASLTIKGYVGDKKFGIDTGWYDYINEHKSKSDSFRYEPTSYAVIQKMIKHVQFTDDDVLIDYGCGSGRVLFATAAQKLKKIIGIEFDEGLVRLAQKNLISSKYKNTPVEIVHGDAINYDPKEGTVIYFGNPFGEKTMNKVLDRIERSLKENPRNIRIIYFNSTSKKLLEERDWLKLDGMIDNNNSGTTVWSNT